MILEIEGLEKKFQQGEQTLWALKDVDLFADKGDFISIIGRSGSGKSTLLNIIAGLLNPSGGSIKLNGRPITNLSDAEASFLRNDEIGYIMQGQSILTNLTVLDNVCLPNRLYTRNENIVPYAEELMTEMGIYHLKEAYPYKLSGGELRRVAIARALINKPLLLLADEPTSNLDEENTTQVMKIFQKVAARGTIVLMVTHELDTVEYGSRLYRMDAGILKQQ